MSDSLQKWVDSIMGLFASYNSGYGIMYQTIESKFCRSFGKERIEFLFVYCNLLQNGLLEQDGNYFVVLSDKGFEYINSDSPNKLNVYFENLKPLSKTNDELFANLWHIIGQQDKCLCYIDGKTFFDSISDFFPIIGNYSEYMKELHETTGNTSRITWYKDLFKKLPDEEVERFLEKLSEKYNQSEALANQASPKDEENNVTLDIFEDMNIKDAVKKNKIFISHCGEDKVEVNALVDLLGEVINLSSNNLFCSSAHGFDVMVGKNFMDNILEQYHKHNLFLIYVLSHNYMGSPICLNEMGASWMTRTDSIGILLPGFDIKDLGNSCYDKQSISIIFDQEEEETRHRLNQLKETVERLFPDDVREIGWSRWEEKRNEFITKVKAFATDKRKDALEVSSLTHGEGRTPNATIASSVFYRGNGSYLITFTNQGVQTAENVFVDFEEEDSIILLLEKDLFPIELLKPGRSFQIRALMTEGAPHKMMSHIKWKEDDDMFEEDELVLFNQ